MRVLLRGRYVRHNESAGNWQMLPVQNGLWSGERTLLEEARHIMIFHYFIKAKVLRIYRRTLLVTYGPDRIRTGDLLRDRQTC